MFLFQVTNSKYPVLECLSEFLASQITPKPTVRYSIAFQLLHDHMFKSNPNCCDTASSSSIYSSVSSLHGLDKQFGPHIISGVSCK